MMKVLILATGRGKRITIPKLFIRLGQLAMVFLLGSVSQYGCTTQPLQETRENINQTAVSGTMIHPRQEPLEQPGPSANKDLSGPLTLEMLERLARRHNPTLGQASAQIEGERAKALQAGLYPNPTIGYIGDQIGTAGTAGEFQGGFVQQEFVTAGKLRLSREKYRARASAAEFQALAQEYRVINEVRILYYRTLGAQERLAIQRELLKNAQDSLVTMQELVNLGQANEADRHQNKVLLGDQQLNVRIAENDRALAWEMLMAVVGAPRPLETMTGILETPTEPIEWDVALRRLLAESPELGVARAILKSDKIKVQREKVEPIPNLILQGSAGRNYESHGTVYGVEAFITLPIFDRNQGTVRQAQADLRRQQAQVRVTELRLRRTLAEQFQRYRTARQHVETYRNTLLPEAQERYGAQLKSYGENRVAWPAVLEAQQDYFLRRVTYVNQLVAWQEAKVAIDGLLLVDGLMAPQGVAVPGHIDAVPKPR